MRPFKFFIIFILLAVMTMVSVGHQSTYASEQEYKPKAKATILVETPLAGVEGKTVIIKHFEFPPGHVGGWHTHSGPVFVYVLEGEITIDTENTERRTITVGELYQEPIGTKMQARNLSATEPTKIIVFQVSEEGKPMMIETK
ncbi:MAG: cupin domain-containing protein [Desulfobulbaceae bacterium]|jgi:quercetin dioxygenase-like cupin family protein